MTFSKEARKDILLGLTVIAMLFGALWGIPRVAHCNSWVCVGPCGTHDQCGYGCVCVGASTDERQKGTRGTEDSDRRCLLDEHSRAHQSP